jgi:hypothetical protein
MNIQFCCYLCCSSCDFSAQSFSMSGDLRPLFLSAHIVFPLFVYSDITLHTVALYTSIHPIMWQFLSPILFSKRAPTICPLVFKIGEVSHFSIFSRIQPLNTITRHTNATKSHTVHGSKTVSVANGRSFSVTNTNKLYSSIS